jgi:hypothetical protein
VNAYIGTIKSELEKAKINLESLADKTRESLRQSLTDEEWKLEEAKTQDQRDEIAKIIKDNGGHVSAAIGYKFKEKSLIIDFCNYATINSSEKMVNSFLRKGEAAFGQDKFASYRDEIEFAFDDVRCLQSDLFIAREEREKERNKKLRTFEQIRKEEPIFKGKLWKVAEQYETDYVTKFVAECRAAFEDEQETKRCDGKRFLTWTDQDQATATEAAKFQILKYVVKLSQKIGKEISSADLSGDLWTNSTLTVECEDGDKQVWNTRHITNYSCYGTPFSQFPTRKEL